MPFFNCFSFRFQAFVQMVLFPERADAGRQGASEQHLSGFDKFDVYTFVGRNRFAEQMEIGRPVFRGAYHRQCGLFFSST